MRATPVTVDVLPGGVLVKLGAKPVYFSRQRSKMLLERPDDVRVEDAALLGREAEGTPSFSSVPLLKSGCDARYRSESLGHVGAKSVLQRAVLALVIVALLDVIGHIGKPIRKWSVR